MTHTAPQLEASTDPIHTPAHLRERWASMIGPLGFSERLLWYAFVGPDRRLLTVMNHVIKVLHHVEVGPVPRPDLVDGVIASLRTAIAELPRTTVALLLTRPGSDGVTVADRQWATMLTGTAKRYGVPLEPLFRANDRELLRIVP